MLKCTEMDSDNEVGEEPTENNGFEEGLGQQSMPLISGINENAEVSTLFDHWLFFCALILCPHLFTKS